MMGCSASGEAMISSYSTDGAALFSIASKVAEGFFATFGATTGVAVAVSGAGSCVLGIFCSSFCSSATAAAGTGCGGAYWTTCGYSTLDSS